VLLLIDYFAGRKMDKKAIFDKIPFFALALFIGIITMTAQESAAFKPEYHTLFERFLIANYGLMMYLYKLFVPLNLTCFYRYPEKIKGIYYVAPFIILGLILALVLLVIWLKRREAGAVNFSISRSIVFGCLFFLITITPVLQF